MEERYLSYLALLGDLSKSLDQLSELAKQKAAAVRRDDLIGLDEVLKQEQAQTLNLRGLELRRQKLVGELGLEGIKLSGLAARCPGHLEYQARQAAETLHRSYQIYQSRAEVARNTLECNLHEIEKVIAAAGIDPAAGAGYAAPSAEPPRNMKTDFRA